MHRALTNKKMLLPLGAALGALMMVQPALADCASVDAKIRAAINAGDRGQFPALHQEVIGKSGCASKYQTRVARIMALASLKILARESKASGKEPSLTDLKQASTLAQPWQVMVTLGDAYYEAKDWANAFKTYEVALDDMRDEIANPKAPPEAVERRTRTRALQARALSPTFVASRAIGGTPSGVSATKFRNFSVQSVPVPIKFQYNSADLTPDGVRAAEEIYNFAISNNAKGIKLYGHTDPIGSDDYNFGLSLSRAESVRVYLMSKGYAGHIEVVGKGESEPFQADDPGKYSQEELFSMYRRVEFEAIH